MATKYLNVDERPVIKHQDAKRSIPLTVFGHASLMTIISESGLY
jgi:hypothetical protein